MDTIKTYIIKGMVCNRCITTLKQELEQHHLNVNDVSLGKVGLVLEPEQFDESRFTKILLSLGFSIGVNKNNRVVDQVKSIVRNYFQQLDPHEEKIRFSDLISDKLNMTYDNISSIFSAHEKMTIENYIILYRIRIVKDLLQNTSYSLTEIAYRTGFNSIHHLSRQFKEVVGISPSDYKNQIVYKNDAINQKHDITFILKT
ncbi:MAG: helix-turn-helix protein [Bacteroidetes bacterium]|jgi:AraC-like DNA-binding protein|nr:helix-turn-helix protein [Bacteroidota bacterium]